MSPSRRRLAAYVLVVVAGAWGFWRQEMTINRQDDLIVDNKAQACVDDWEAAEGNRDGHERSIRSNNRILIQGSLELFGSEIDEDTAERFREIFTAQADNEVELVRDEVPDPACDLAAAREQLGLPIGDNPR